MTERVEIKVKVRLYRRCLEWLAMHPYSGWYVGFIVTLHLLLDALGFM